MRSDSAVLEETPPSRWFGRDDQRISDCAGLDSVGGGASHPLRLLEVHARRKLYVLDLCYEVRCEEPTAYLVDQLDQRLVMGFDVVYRQPHGPQVAHVASDGLCVCNARDPSDEPSQLGRQTAAASQVAETEASARQEDPSDLRGGGMLVWKRAVGALAQHR